MVFTDLEFVFIFLPFVLAVTHLIKERGGNLRAAVILLASLSFYAVWSVKFAIYLAIGMVSGYALGLAIDRYRRYAKPLLVASVVLCLLPLAYYKYGVFITSNLALSVPDSLLYHGAIPLGISFFTFTQIAYLVGVYRSVYPAEGSLARYGFFLVFFPHLVAGPIVRYDHLVPQLDQEPDKADYALRGLVYFVIGFSKKLFLADSIARLVDPLFAAHAVNSFQDAITATVGYTLQLYFDFSGYSDMAVGLAFMLGFVLPINFNSPYKSESIGEFWNRWHITLSTFLREFIYIPLGGNRGGLARTCRNLFLTLLIGGLWHGAGWTFVLWGGAHGLALVVHRLWLRLRERTGWQSSWWTRPAAVATTLTFVVLAWVLFRADSLQQAGAIYLQLAHPGPVHWSGSIALLALGCVLLVGPNSHRIVAVVAQRGAAARAWALGFVTARMAAYAVTGWALFYLSAVLFYTTGYDRWLYPLLPGVHPCNGTDHRVGDYRANLFDNEIFVGDQRKVVFVGSSFGMMLGIYEFDHNGRHYKSGTVANGGYLLLQGLRGAMAVLNAPNVAAIVLPISPLNMSDFKWLSPDLSPANFSWISPFEHQCQDDLKELELNVGPTRLSSCRPVPLTLTDAGSIADFRSEALYQFRSLFSVIWNMNNATRLDPFVCAPAQVELTAAAGKKFLADWEAYKQRPATVPIREREDMSDAKMHWAQRGVLEGLRPGGAAYNALLRLAHVVHERGIRFVIYDTPIVQRGLGPDTYPPGFIDDYKAAVRRLVSDADIEYYDLTQFAPENGNFFVDGIHMRYEVREMLHKYLLLQLFGTPAAEAKVAP